MNTEIRPCIIQVNETATLKGLFYDWVDYPYTNGAGGQAHEIAGLVEMEDGSVVFVPPMSVKFLDSARYFNQYMWENPNENTQNAEHVAEEVEAEIVG